MLLKKDARAGYNAGDGPELSHIWTDYLSLWHKLSISCIRFPL